jgi:hypothetical protein
VTEGNGIPMVEGNGADRCVSAAARAPFPGQAGTENASDTEAELEEAGRLDARAAAPSAPFAFAADGAAAFRRIGQSLYPGCRPRRLRGQRGAGGRTGATEPAFSAAHRRRS